MLLLLLLSSSLGFESIAIVFELFAVFSLWSIMVCTKFLMLLE